MRCAPNTSGGGWLVGGDPRLVVQVTSHKNNPKYRRRFNISLLMTFLKKKKRPRDGGAICYCVIAAPIIV